MNYIHQLQEDIKEKTEEIARLNDIIHNLRVHMYLSKFDYPNDYINVKDVLNLL